MCSLLICSHNYIALSSIINPFLVWLLNRTPLLDTRTFVLYNDNMCIMHGLIRYAASTNSLHIGRRIFDPLGSIERISCSPTTVGVEPGVNGHAGRVEPQLNTYFSIDNKQHQTSLSGGVELESNPAVTPVTLPKNKEIIFDAFISTEHEVRSRRSSHLPGGFELDSFPARTTVTLRKMRLPQIFIRPACTEFAGS